MTKNKNNSTNKTPVIIPIFLWVLGLLPLMIILGLLEFQTEDDLPSLEMLDNPPELLASVIFSDDGQTEIGRYWQVNRTNVDYKDISPFVTSALISTEDERFVEHSGVDFKSLGRAIVKAGSAGGGSTITQQLAKLLYTLKQRETEKDLKAAGHVIPIPSKYEHILSRINEKAQENIIATRLEERYTKEEIISMYLNQFDFLYNAVGIENAAKVYYNKPAKDLTKDEAAMLVGMCKNPSLYNPLRFKKINYRQRIASQEKIDITAVKEEAILAAKEKDSLRAVSRRNQVLYQWLRNSKKNNAALMVQITQEEYDSLSQKPLITDYRSVDHKDGIAPYFREVIRKEIKDIFDQTDEQGNLLYAKKDGSKWNVYNDGLRIYTTINVDLQNYAEEAVERHLRENLQPAFDKNNANLKIFPFANGTAQTEIDKIMRLAIINSDRYRLMKANGIEEDAILKSFQEPSEMTIFSWSGDRDTIMTPYDSIRYYKSYLRSGLISIEPGTGFIKAWVGGPNMNYFAYDQVKQGKRQVGSTIKPFVYASAMTMGVANPCTTFPNTQHCVDLFDEKGRPDGQWCPRNSDGKMTGEAITMTKGLQNSMNNITVAIMQAMGAKSGPQTINQILKTMGVDLDPAEVVPAMCLGTMDLSLYELVGAQTTFVNGGIFVEPTAILRIEDRNGNVIYNASPKVTEALNENVAYATLKMMRRVVEGGTAWSLRGPRSWGGILYPTAGKTGTTQSNADGWFMGLTPHLVTGVWTGAEDRVVRFRTMEWGQGARLALPIYGYYMQKAYKNPKLKLAEGDFIQPEGFAGSNLDCTGAETPEVGNDDSITI